jgi:hypothetical protein
MYSLNTVLKLRHILDPANPYVAFMGAYSLLALEFSNDMHTAPWVHPDQSGTLRALNLLPTNMMNNWHVVAKFLATNVNAAFTFSSTAVTSVLPKRQPTAAADSYFEADFVAAQEALPYAESGAFCAPNADNARDFSAVVMKYVWAEDTCGGSEEAKLCLKRGGQNIWGCFESYEDAVNMVLERETAVSSQAPNAAKLKINVFLAAEDGLVGLKGGTYLDRCWRGDDDRRELGLGRHGGDRLGEIDYESVVVESVGHDEIIANVEYGVVERIFKAVTSDRVPSATTYTSTV